MALNGVGLLERDNSTDSNWTTGNSTLDPDSYQEAEYPFDRTDVQAIFISLYSIVFCSCFFGNLLVILVVTLHWRMRSITNFCLANLAFADLCVGVFCVYQNLSTYLIASWVFGDFMCKMYHFINSLSHTASILILVVICVERYLAIIHPMQCKQLLTLNRLRFTIISVWLISALYSSPRLYYINTITIPRHDGETEIICTPTRTLYDSVTFDIISMLVLFILPLVVISVLYTRIGIVLWRTSHSNMPNSSASESSSSSYREVDSPHGTHHSSDRFRHLTLCSCLCPNTSSSCRKRFSRRRHHHHHRAHSQSFDDDDGPTNATALTNFTPDLELTRRKSHKVNGHYNGSSNSNSPCPTHHPHSPLLLQSSSSQAEPISTAEPIILVKFERNNGSSSFKKKKRERCTILFNSTAATQSPPRSPRLLQSAGGVPQFECQDCMHSMGSSSSAPGVSSSSPSSSTSRLKAQHHPSILTSNGTALLNGNSPHLLHSIGPLPPSPAGASSGSGSPAHNNKHGGKLKRMRVLKSVKYGTRALQSRRRIVRMLIVIVVTFAVCNLPFHARKMWQIFGKTYRGGSVFSALFTPSTFLIMYANSGINPLLYAFMSHKFRLSFQDLLCCKLRQSVKFSRRASGRSTHLQPLSTAM